MSDFPDTAGLHSLLPAEPGQWVWSRVKVYLAVIAGIVVGFFFFADWYAGPSGRNPFSLLQATMMLFYGLVAFFSWRTARRELNKQHHHGGK